MIKYKYQNEEWDVYWASHNGSIFGEDTGREFWLVGDGGELRDYELSPYERNEVHALIDSFNMENSDE